MLSDACDRANLLDSCKTDMPSYSDIADKDLLASLMQGDESAFTEIYTRYWKKLFVTASHRLNSFEDAEEIVQDIFVSLWNRRHRLDVHSDLSGYLAVSVKYRVIKMLDSHYNEKRYIDSIMTKGLIDDSTQELLAFEELKEELARYVQELPEKCQLVFKLSREDGYSQKQIAEELGVSEKTVESHLGKAFKTLRTKLKGFMMTLL